MDFTEDPFKDYRYEDPFNIEDPFADAVDARRPTSVAGFETDLFAPAPAPPRGGRVSAPPVQAGPPGAWAAWPDDNWAADDAWAEPARPAPAAKPLNNANSNADAWAGNSSEPAGDWKTDNWASKADGWAADWGADHNRNLNETWPSSTLPGKKERSPKPVKYAKSLVHTIGGIGRAKHKEKKAKALEALPSEEQQWAWAAAESARLQAEQDARRRQEDAELQLALAISRQEK